MKRNRINIEDLIGVKINRWTILQDMSDGRKKVLCECSCIDKTRKIVQVSDLLSKKSKSCGCLKRETTSQNLRIDLVGKKFERLTVLECVGENKNKKLVWKCICNCSEQNIVFIVGQSLRSGITQSCGCLNKEIVKYNNKTHDKSYSLEYNTWKNMIQRCYNSNNNAYKNYGERGITVCDEWLEFENFYRDMGNKPGPEYSIDRIDNNGNYCKENCRWTTDKEQSRNKRTTKLNKHRVNRIREFYWADVGVPELAKLFDVHVESIRHIVKNMSWT